MAAAAGPAGTWGPACRRDEGANRGVSSGAETRLVPGKAGRCGAAAGQDEAGMHRQLRYNQSPVGLQSVSRRPAALSRDGIACALAG